MNKDLTNIQNIYFVGAGGIGMAALERYFLAKGKNVAGYDRTSTALTDELCSEGVEISFDESIDSIRMISAILIRHLWSTLQLYLTVFRFLNTSGLTDSMC